jgi:hypothetical protein
MSEREVIARAVLNNFARAYMSARDDADAILAALDAAGLAVVPVEPTEAMIDAAHRAWTPGVNYGEAHAIRWHAMLAAAAKEGER